MKKTALRYWRRHLRRPNLDKLVRHNNGRVSQAKCHNREIWASKPQTLLELEPRLCIGFTPSALR